jgi:hypothetical protein
MQYWEPLLRHLDKTHRVKASKVVRLLAETPHGEDRPEQVLVEQGVMTRHELLAAKSELMKVAACPIEPEALDRNVVWLVPQAMAQRYKAVCVGREDGRLVLAMVDPNDAFATDYIQMRTGYEIDRRVAYAGDVEAVIARLYESGPPVGRAPGSIREKVGQDVVRARTLDTVPIARPRRIEVDDDLTETPTLAVRPIPSVPTGRRVSLGEAPSAASVALEIARLNLDLCAERDEDRVIDKMLDTVMRIFPVEAASLLLIDWEKSQLYFREARGPGKRDVMEMALPLDPESSVAAWCVAHREPVNIAEASADPRHCAAVDQQLGYVTHSLLAVPVLWND